MDYRDVIAIKHRWYKRLDEKKMVVIAELSFEDEEGFYDEEVEVPFVYEVCDVCDGIGSYVNPSIDSHGITADEWYGEWDEDERDMYMSGGYNVQCKECNGTRVVPMPDKDRMTEDMYNKVNEYISDLYQSARERCHEREMGY